MSFEFVLDMFVTQKNEENIKNGSRSPLYNYFYTVDIKINVIKRSLEH